MAHIRRYIPETETYGQDMAVVSFMQVAICVHRTVAPSRGWALSTKKFHHQWNFTQGLRGRTLGNAKLKRKQSQRIQSWKGTKDLPLGLQIQDLLDSKKENKKGSGRERGKERRRRDQGEGHRERESKREGLGRERKEGRGRKRRREKQEAGILVSAEVFYQLWVTT